MNDTPTPVSETASAAPLIKKHYHMFAIMVVYFDGKMERRKFLNTINASLHPFVSAFDLARIQQETQVRFHKEFDKTKKYKLIDLYVQSISYMGLMTPDQFEGGLKAAAEAELRAIEAANAPKVITDPKELQEVVDEALAEDAVASEKPQ